MYEKIDLEAAGFLIEKDNQAAFQLAVRCRRLLTQILHKIQLTVCVDMSLSYTLFPTNKSLDLLCDTPN